MPNMKRTIEPMKLLKTIILSKPTVTLCFFVALAIGCANSSKGYTIKVMQHNHHWIYTVEHQGKTIIKQETIPGVQGIQYFPDHSTATKTASLVKHKLTRGQSPTISQEEMELILNTK